MNDVQIVKKMNANTSSTKNTDFNTFVLKMTNAKNEIKFKMTI